jgi:hypothetical protein
MSMRFVRLSVFSFIITGVALLLTGCQGLAKIPASSTSTQTTGTAAAIRSYNGTASVGDFVTISIDSTAGTITYHDVSNGEQGTVSYAVNADGTYSINDPQGNVLAAYEVPGFVMLVEAVKAGPNQNTPALITAVESAPASILNFAGQNFNYLQFRTAAGGIEIGSVSVDSQGNIQHNSYSPMALVWGNGQYFDSGNFAASSITEDPSGNYFTINEQDSSKDVVFGTQNGLWANAETGGNNFEIGSATQGTSTAVVAADGTITITDAQNNVLATGTLVPVADAAYLYDGTVNTLSDPCNGLFTVRIATSNSQQDLFVAFQGNAVIFGSFQSALPGQNSNPYTYFYGVGLK